jgi:membrane-bound serine protease (ClpP class)
MRGSSMSFGRVVRLLWSLVLLVAGLASGTAGADPAPVAPVGRTFVVPIEQEIDLGLAPFVERVLAGAGADDTVILHLNTFGGRIDAAVRIRDAVLASRARTIAFIDKRAISAGALISLATNTIVMARGATIGAATPVQIEGGKMQPVEQKVVSYMRKEMKATAEARGRRGDIAEAMVDSSVVVEGWGEKNTTLTLTTTEALKLGVASFTAETLAEVCAENRCSAQDPVHTEPNWAERAAGFLTDSTVSSVLIALGMLGIMLELNAPGHALAGGLGVLALILFFFGHYVVHLAGWGAILLFVVGAAAIVFEVFFWPGHGVLAIAGALAILASLSLALMGGGALPFGVTVALGWVTHAVARVLGAMMATALVMILASRWLPQSRLGRRFILDTAITAQAGPTVGALDQDTPALVGPGGVAATALRPAGKAIFDGKRVDVVTDGVYIDAGTEVIVASVEGARVVVRAKT